VACNGGGAFAPPPEQGPDEPPFGPNFSEIQANVFTPTCAASGCHIGIGVTERSEARSSEQLRPVGELSECSEYRHTARRAG
jgi:hypothetical protein